MTQPTNFVWFEFDKEVQTLWQSLSSPATDKPKFAYENRLKGLFAEHGMTQPDGVNTTLDSLKVLDVFLSAVKSDLASRQTPEIKLLNHDAFVKLVVVIAYHVWQVLGRTLGGALTFHKTQSYADKGFSRVYARTFTGLDTPPVDEHERDGFYQGLVFLATGLNATGQKVAQSLFVLSVIGARIFGSLDRHFFTLQPNGNASPTPSEDSLYWVVSDFLANFDNLHDESAKALFEPKTTPTTSASSVASSVISDHARTTQNTQKVVSERRQKARASHTPKLFDEVYQDLVSMPMPSDGDGDYQKAVGVLNRFDEHIKTERAKGKTLDEIVFSAEHQAVRTQALRLLAGLVQRNNPSAMLRLGVYYAEGRGMTADTAKAVMLIRRSAEMSDPRAQKLLSRLYYQGFDPDNGGLAMESAMGEMWLRKSADNGHPEAKKICAYMNQVEILKDDYRADIESDQRYIKWGIAFFALVIVIVFIMSVMIK